VVGTSAGTLSFSFRDLRIHDHPCIRRNDQSEIERVLGMAVLEVKDLKIYYKTLKGYFKAVDECRSRSRRTNSSGWWVNPVWKIDHRQSDPEDPPGEWRGVRRRGPLQGERHPFHETQGVEESPVERDFDDSPERHELL